MLERLKQRWKVNAVDLLLILCTFALGGSLCGWVAKKVMACFGMESGLGWILLYALVMTLVWPISVLLMSVPFGQFTFFKKYLLKMGNRLRGKSAKRVAIFASGAGSNAEKIIESAERLNYQVALVVCNKPDAGVLKIAARHQVPTLLIEKDPFFRGDAYVPALQHHRIDFIVLAGFLWKVPDALIRAFRGHIINIHPALLPKYGGKGMYGNHVHAAVIAAGETQSGITIHQVDEVYDHGDILFQATCEVKPGDTPELLAQRIHQLEHQHYPQQLAAILENAK